MIQKLKISVLVLNILIFFALESTGFNGHFYKNEGFIRNQNILFFTQTSNYAIGFTGNSIEFYFLLTFPAVKQNNCHYDTTGWDLNVEKISLDLGDDWKISSSIEINDVLHYYKNNQYFKIAGFDTIYYYNKTKNIVLRFYLQNEKIKYDIIIRSGRRGKLTIRSNAKVTKDNNHLILTKGDVILQEHIPEIHNENYERIDEIVEIDAKSNLITYSWPDYSGTIIIDPVEYSLKYGSFYGGNNIDYLYKVLTDQQKNIITIGYTLSPNNIATPGAHKTFQQDYDVFIAKFDSNGTRLWGTYFGGPGVELAYSGVIDNANNIIVGGSTMSNTGIATAGAHQTFLASTDDAFLAMFKPNGQLKWSTYYGGNDHDLINDLDYRNGIIYVTGHTRSNGSIATPGSYSNVFTGPEIGFWSKFDTSGTLLYGTYYGSGQYDEPMCIRVNAAGEVFVGGNTTGANNIATPGTHQPSPAGNYETFISKWSAGGWLIWGSYFGGPNAEFFYSLDLDDYGNPYFSGYTESPTGIATTGSYQTNINGLVDGFLAKFNPQNGQLFWSTYIGGSQVEYLRGINLHDGKIYVFGHTASNNTLITPGAFQKNLANGFDNVLLFFDSLGNKIYGTYYGGSGNEFGITVKVMDSLRIVVGGFTDNTNGITTPGAHQTNYGGSFYDGFFSIICKPQPPVVLNYSDTVAICDYDSVYLQSMATYNSYQWNNGKNTQGMWIKYQGNYVLNVIDQKGCPARSDTVFLKVYPAPSFNLSAPSVMCQQDSAWIVAPQGFVSYNWNNGNNNDSILVFDNASYFVTAIDSNGCIRKSDTVSIFIPNPATNILIVGDTIVCQGDSVVLKAGISLNQVNWNTGDTTHQIVPDSSGLFWFTAKDNYGCDVYSDTVSVNFVNAPNPVPFIDSTGVAVLCPGDTLWLQADSGYVNYLWSNGSTSTSIAITDSGKYFVTVTDTNGCYSTSDTLHVLKSQLGNVSVTVTPGLFICPGDSVLLGSHPGLVSVIWNTNDTIPNITAFPGIYYYQGNDSLGCDYYSDTVTIQNFPSFQPVILKVPESACYLQDSIMLSIDSLLFFNFNNVIWNNVLLSDTIYVHQDTALYAQVTDSNGCVWHTDTIQVTFHTPIQPIINSPDTICWSDTLWLSITNHPSFSNIQWSNGSSGVSTYYVMEFLQYYYWSVNLTDTNSCNIFYQDSVFIIMCPNGILESTIHDKVQLHPNPAKDALYIHTDKPVDAIIKIYQVNGIEVMHMKVQLPGSINISNLSQGVYFLSIFKNTQQIYHHRFIKTE